MGNNERQAYLKPSGCVIGGQVKRPRPQLSTNSVLFVAIPLWLSFYETVYKLLTPQTQGVVLAACLPSVIFQYFAYCCSEPRSLIDLTQ